MTDSLIHRSRPQSARRVASILTELGIPFKRKRKTIGCRWGYSFWMENESELEYIYHDLLEKINSLKRQLHPDREYGNQEEFVRINEDAQWLEKMFRRHGVGEPDRVGEIQAKENKRFAYLQLNKARSRQQWEKKKADRRKEKNGKQEHGGSAGCSGGPEP